MEPLSTAAMVFYTHLNESDTVSDPSNEQVVTIQSLIDTSRELDESKSKPEIMDLDKRVYFDAQQGSSNYAQRGDYRKHGDYGKHGPLASIPLKGHPLKSVDESKIKEWIEKEVKEAFRSGSQASN